MKFNAPKPAFGKPTSTESFPAPITGKAIEHRTASLHQAGEILAVLPGPGQTLHALMTGRYDLMHVIAALIGQLGGCTEVRIATLSFNAKNLTEMVELLDNKAIGKLTLLCSAFFRDHNKGLWQECLAGFRKRGHRAAAARNHCKVVTLACQDGRKYSLEGSANLRTNSNREQFVLTHEASVHDWHAAWIEELVSKHEGENETPEA